MSPPHELTKFHSFHTASELHCFGCKICNIPHDFLSSKESCRMSQDISARKSSPVLGTSVSPKEAMSCSLCNTAAHMDGDGEIVWALWASYSKSLMEANYILSKVTVSL